MTPLPPTPARAGRRSLRSPLALAAAVSLLTACAGVPGESSRFVGRLSAAQVLPPTASQGQGELTASLDRDTHLLHFRLSYAQLDGKVIAAHFHAPSSGSRPEQTLTMLSALDSPIEGQITLSAEQIADLRAGRWWVDLHTTAHPGGELRGSVRVKR